MDDYVLRDNERLNGGYTLQIGSFMLRILDGYSPSWENVYDTENSFQNFDGSEEKFLKGIRFSLKINIDRIMPEDFNALISELKKPVIALECPDFEGNCYCDTMDGFRKDVAAAMSNESPALDDKFYVQVGAFASEENARKYLEKVKNDYPDAFIKRF